VLAPYGANEIARVEVRAAEPSRGFAIERSGGTFRVAGTGLRASRAVVDRIFAALADTRAESFVDDATADAALARPAFGVALTARDAKHPRVELRVGGECPGEPEDVVVIRDAPSRVSACAPRTIAGALETAREGLTDESVLFAHADEVEELRLEPVGASGARVELARKGRGWRERAPQDRDLSSDEAESASALVLALAGARGVDPVRTPADEHLAVHARATIVRVGAGDTEVVDVGATGPDGAALVRREDDGAILRVPRAVARRFEPHPVALRARPVWRDPFDAASVVAVDDSCGPIAQRLELHDHVWTMPAPAGFAADAVSVTELTQVLARAKADAWVAETDDGTFGFAAPGSCAISLTLDGGAGAAGPRRAGIAFGAETDAGVYARALGDTSVFVAPLLLRDAVSHPEIDRGRLRLDMRGLTNVMLERRGARIALARAGDHLARTDDARDDGGGEGDLESALAGLYAYAALHPGPAVRGEGFSAPTLEIRASKRTDAGVARTTHIAIGAPTHVEMLDAYFARVSGIDATYAVPRRAVDAILDAW
jgi:hypothetical protein